MATILLASTTLRKMLSFGKSKMELGLPGIIHLAQSVREKNDDDDNVYKIYFKDNHPKLCFLPHLLVFVHCTEHQTGFIYRKGPHPYGADVVEDENPLTMDDVIRDKTEGQPLTYRHPSPCTGSLSALSRLDQGKTNHLMPEPT
jgi:hypothetical protein